MTAHKSLTLFDKVWNRHIVKPANRNMPDVLYIDLQLLHEVTSPQAFSKLREKGLKVRNPDQVFATMDHSTPTLPPRADGSRIYGSDAAKNQVKQLEQNCAEFGIELNGWDSPYRGVVHVTAPECGRILPGMTIVCGDSHTATHGAFGALAFGIGTTEVAHVLASQCLLQNKPKNMAVIVTGHLQEGVSAKDLVLAIIAKTGVHGGTGHVIEYQGECIRQLSMEGRMTLCNMSIELGARAGMIKPDNVTLEWLKKHWPKSDMDRLMEMSRRWDALASDEGAHFDRVITLDASTVQPMVTYGTNPSMGAPISQKVPESGDENDMEALKYMNTLSGQAMEGRKVDTVFIGSCTNGRLEDLEVVASIMEGKTIAKDVRVMIVPGSVETKRQAEEKGFSKIFLDAGAEWREAGCSMCLAMNGDMAKPGELVVSTSNRNFMGRQGPGARTVLASPATAAASAITGKITDPRDFLLNDSKETANG